MKRSEGSNGPDTALYKNYLFLNKCPAELNFDCMILIRSMPSTGVK